MIMDNVLTFDGTFGASGITGSSVNSGTTFVANMETDTANILDMSQIASSASGLGRDIGVGDDPALEIFSAIQTAFTGGANSEMVVQLFGGCRQRLRSSGQHDQHDDRFVGFSHCHSVCFVNHGFCSWPRHPVGSRDCSGGVRGHNGDCRQHLDCDPFSDGRRRAFHAHGKLRDSGLDYPPTVAALSCRIFHRRNRDIQGEDSGFTSDTYPEVLQAQLFRYRRKHDGRRNRFRHRARPPGAGAEPGLQKRNSVDHVPVHVINRGLRPPG